MTRSQRREGAGKAQRQAKRTEFQSGPMSPPTRQRLAVFGNGQSPWCSPHPTPGTLLVFQWMLYVMCRPVAWEINPRRRKHTTSPTWAELDSVRGKARGCMEGSMTTRFFWG